MAVREGLTIDGLALNDGVTYVIQGLEMPPPAKRPEWVSGGDSDGAVLGRDPLSDNRVITARVRVVQQSTMDLALAAIAAISDKLEEAERNSTGVDVVWTPMNSANSLTFKCLSGEITELPLVLQGEDFGYVKRFPVITVKLTCRPFGYGAEVVGTPASSSLPLMTVDVTGVTGDVPAEGRLIITDNASKDRRHVEWGLESRNYPTSSPPDLILDSDSLVTSGFAGTQTTRTGAYDPGASGNNVIRTTLAVQHTACCGTGNQNHVGTFRVKARVWAAATSTGTVFTRLSWQEGDGPMRSNAYVSPPIINGFAEVDLGLITIPEKELGTQRWTGTVHAYSTVIGETIDVDYLMLIPVGEGYGVARGEYMYQPGVLVARDEFTSTTSGNNLNARVAPLGGTWATSGDATDFTFADAPGGGETVTRATTNETTGRFAILGSTSYTNIEAGVSSFVVSSQIEIVRRGVIVRYTDNSNFLRLSVYEFNAVARNLVLEQVVAGVATTLDETAIGIAAGAFYGLRVLVYTSGRAIGQLLDANGVVLATLTSSSSVLATGGTLATGKIGFHDRHSSATSRVAYYDWFYATTPAPEPVVLYSGQSLEVRSDSALREDSSGTYWGPLGSYRGSRFYMPVAGTRARKTRVAVKMRRNEVGTGPDDQIADSTTVQVNYIPRYLVVPR